MGSTLSSIINDPNGHARENHPRRANPGAVAGHGQSPPPGLVIIGAWITQKLDLDDEVVPVRLALLRCTLKEDVILIDCTLPGLSLNGSQLPALTADRLICKGSLSLRHGFRATGKVGLAGAKITGQLVCAGGSFWQRMKSMWR